MRDPKLAKGMARDFARAVLRGDPGLFQEIERFASQLAGRLDQGTGLRPRDFNSVAEQLSKRLKADPAFIVCSFQALGDRVGLFEALRLECRAVTIEFPSGPKKWDQWTVRAATLDVEKKRLYAVFATPPVAIDDHLIARYFERAPDVRDLLVALGHAALIGIGAARSCMRTEEGTAPLADVAIPSAGGVLLGGLSISRDDCFKQYTILRAGRNVLGRSQKKRYMLHGQLVLTALRTFMDDALVEPVHRDVLPNAQLFFRSWLPHFGVCLSRALTPPAEGLNGAWSRHQADHLEKVLDSIRDYLDTTGHVFEHWSSRMAREIGASDGPGGFSLVDPE